MCVKHTSLPIQNVLHMFQIFPVCKYKQHRRQRGCQIISHRLARSQHTRRVENLSEGQQDWNINNPLSAHRQDKRWKCSPCRLNCIDKHKHQAQNGAGININAGKLDAELIGIGVIQKCLYEAARPEIADCCHNQAQAKRKAQRKLHHIGKPLFFSVPVAVTEQRLYSTSKSDQKHYDNHIYLHGHAESSYSHISVTHHQIVDNDVRGTH